MDILKPPWQSCSSLTYHGELTEENLHFKLRWCCVRDGNQTTSLLVRTDDVNQGWDNDAPLRQVAKHVTAL